MSLRIHGNRPLKTLPGQATRPTPARVREALFNIWQPSSITDCRWLDLCTGSGAMGAEALSRGAALVVGVEQSGRACAVIQQNWQRIAKPGQQFKIIRADVVKALPTLAGQQFDRIYVDPPYASELYLPVLRAIAQNDLLAAEGEIAMEHKPNRWTTAEFETLLEAIAPLRLMRQKTYGNTALSFFSVSSG